MMMTKKSTDPHTCQKLVISRGSVCHTDTSSSLTTSPFRTARRYSNNFMQKFRKSPSLLSRLFYLLTCLHAVLPCSPPLEPTHPESSVKASTQQFPHGQTRIQTLGNEAYLYKISQSLAKSYSQTSLFQRPLITFTADTPGL